MSQDVELQELKNVNNKRLKQGPKVDQMFERIEISTFKLFMDPIISSFCLPCKFKCCKRQGTARRMKILEKCDDRFAQEIDLS